jgi:hypothetical protein
MLIALFRTVDREIVKVGRCSRLPPMPTTWYAWRFSPSNSRVKLVGRNRHAFLQPNDPTGSLPRK